MDDDAVIAALYLDALEQAKRRPDLGNLLAFLDVREMWAAIAGADDAAMPLPEPPVNSV